MPNKARLSAPRKGLCFVASLDSSFDAIFFLSTDKIPSIQVAYAPRAFQLGLVCNHFRGEPLRSYLDESFSSTNTGNLCNFLNSVGFGENRAEQERLLSTTILANK